MLRLIFIWLLLACEKLFSGKDVLCQWIAFVRFGGSRRHFEFTFSLFYGYELLNRPFRGKCIIKTLNVVDIVLNRRVSNVEMIFLIWTLSLLFNLFFLIIALLFINFILNSIFSFWCQRFYRFKFLLILFHAVWVLVCDEIIDIIVAIEATNWATLRYNFLITESRSHLMGLDNHF